MNFSNEPSSHFGDKVLIATVAMVSCATMVMGAFFFEQTQTTLIGVTAFLLFAAIGYGLTNGTNLCRYVVAVALVGLTALQIQVGRGMLELHFGVFVVLSVLLVYLDWKIIVFTSTLFTLHLVIFNRLQVAGLPIYFSTDTNFMVILFHASYLFAQSSMEVLLAILMGRAALEGEQLSRMVARVNQPEHISLDIEDIPASTTGSIALKSALQRMANAVDTIRESAAQVESSSEEIASGNMDLSHRTERTAGHLNGVAANINNLTHSTEQSADNTMLAKSVAENANHLADKGYQVVDGVIQTMQSIQESSQNISTIISVIDNIAFQTNILALNAAVEAARAGERGRGFAVVATEVRNLAGRSSSAANEIKSLIMQSVDRVKQGTELVGSAGTTMTDIVKSNQQMVEIISEISESTTIQANSSAEIRSVVPEIDDSTQQNAALVEEMAAASSSLNIRAVELFNAISVFSTPNSKNTAKHSV